MVFDILKGSSKPKYCLVVPGPNPGDFTVECEPKGDRLRQVADMEKVCAIEIHPSGQVYSLCDKGTAIVARLAQLKLS